MARADVAERTSRPLPEAAATLRPSRLRPGVVAVAVLVLLLAVAAGLLIGPVHLAPWRVLASLADRLPWVHLQSGLSAQDDAILWELRAPRVVLAGLVGLTLAMSGASYQGVFRNPLADPYLLGVAAGAGLGATIAAVYLPAAAAGAVGILPAAAFVGGLVAAAMTYVLGRSGGPARSAGTLILAGVAVASLFTAAQTFLQQAHVQTLRQVYSWILGTLGTASWTQVRLILPYVVVSATALLLHRRLLDVMGVGEEEARALGVNPSCVRAIVVIAATLGTAAAVSVSGLIGFVGIIVPHTVRLIAGTSYRLILPLSILYGAAFLILADIIARTAAAPEEIPIGVITALIGAPFFLVVLRSSSRSFR